MGILYKSTRNDSIRMSASEAILQGLSKDGGLFVPTEIPALDVDIEALAGMNYKDIAYLVMSKFFTDYTEEELTDCINKAYDSKFDTEEIAPVVKAGNAFYMELYHGATIAFKDMALSILPHLLTTAARKNGITDEIVILTATSGDTGKAALSGFADVPGTKIVVYYPAEGVSNIQRLQMVTQRGDNTCVIGVEGNFDDCQGAVKRMFNDPTLTGKMKDAHMRFSSANSINIGRLVPQVAYYVWAYSRLVKSGEIKAGDAINFVVPTGNFGNILAGFYAKKMGLPVNKLICASNDNKVLYDFFKTGTYDKNREFILTTSPSMDILVSSNLERLIYYVSGEDSAKTALLMSELSSKGSYTVDEAMKDGLGDFVPGWADEAENTATIKKVYEENNYIIDTHTGVAACVYDKYVAKTGDVTPSVIVSTASPFKFLKAVLEAVRPHNLQYMSEHDMIYALDEEMGKGKIPNAIKEILAYPIRHRTVCGIDKMEEKLKSFLGIE